MEMEPRDSMGDPERREEPMGRRDSSPDGPGQNPTCRRVDRVFERLIEGDLTQGDPDVVEICALKAHLASCETCRDLYALDLALIESIRTAPDRAFESVAAEVVGTVRARERRSLVLRWAPIIGVASWVSMVAVLYGRDILKRLIELMTGGIQSSPLLEGLSRAAGAAMKVLQVIRTVAFDTALDSGTLANGPGLVMGTLLAGALVIIMMYGMGIWLGKPREVRSWHRSS